MENKLNHFIHIVILSCAVTHAQGASTYTNYTDNKFWNIRNYSTTSTKNLKIKSKVQKQFYWSKWHCLICFSFSNKFLTSNLDRHSNMSPRNATTSHILVGTNCQDCTYLALSVYGSSSARSSTPEDLISASAWSSAPRDLISAPPAGSSST